MGKSNKKIKSDRINALRKQYDAFVEEDKKRKERNEYILGRLDKMRYCTTLVPVRHKTTASIDRPSVTSPGHQPIVPVIRDLQPPVISNNQLLTDTPMRAKLDENYLINEISKNYILIPKLRSPYMNSNLQLGSLAHNSHKIQDMPQVQSVNTSNTSHVMPNANDDWKSKYDILNILKNEEKGKLANQLPEEVQCDSQTLPNMKSGSEYKYLNDLPEKDMPAEKLNREIKGNRPNNNTILHGEETVSIQENVIAHNVLNAEDDIVSINQHLQNTNLDNYYFEDSNGKLPKLAANDLEQAYYTEPAITVECSETINNANSISDENLLKHNEEKIDHNLVQKQENIEKVEHGGYDMDNVQVISSPELMKEINSASALPNSDMADYVQYVTENMKVQEYTPNVDFDLKQNPVVSEQDIASGEINNFEGRQQSYVDITQHQQLEGQQQFYVDVTQQQQLEGQQQSHVDATQQQQLEAHEQSYMNVTQQQQLEGQQQAYMDITQQQQLEGPEQTYVDATKQQHLEGQQQSYIDITKQYQQEDLIQQEQEMADGIREQPPYNEEVQQPITENIDTSNVTDHTHIDDIEAFDAEQKEMFYSEDSPQNYQYQQPNATYDQGYAQNVTYQENQENAYYENTDQVYNPVDLGENEEQTLRYDPAYRQQYEDPYEKAYENQKEQPQLNESIEQGDLEHVEQMQYEGYNDGQVESTLYSEEGYDQKQNEAPVEQANMSEPGKQN